MSALPTPVPIVLCGRTVVIGKKVAELLLPEYEGSFDDFLHWAFKYLQWLINNSGSLHTKLRSSTG